MSEGRKRIFLIAGIIVLLSVLAALCGTLLYDSMRSQEWNQTKKSQTEQIEIELVYAYQNPQWNSAIETIVRNFEEKYSNIKVNYEVNYGNKVYEAILTKKIARNELGDIVQLKTPGMYTGSDTLGEISSEVSDLVDVTYSVDGKVYGVGAVEATSGILYNKQIFEKYGLEEPKNYEDFLNICRILKNKGITPIGIGGSDLWHMEYWVNHFFRVDVLSQNPDWLKDCGEDKADWTDDAAVKMLSDLRQLFTSGYVNYDWQTTGDGNLPYKMVEGEIAMMYTGPWTSAAIEKLDASMELGWFYVPDEDGNIYAGDNLDTFWSVTKSCEADSKKYMAAMTFLKYFYSEENYRQVCEATSTFPLTKMNDQESSVGGENNNTENGVAESNDTQRTSSELSKDLQAEIVHAFHDSDLRITTYIGDEDTPQDFEKNMLLLVQSCLSGENNVADTATKIQNLWEQCISRQEVDE